MKTDSFNEIGAPRICGCCHRELPAEEFYRNTKTGRTDSYCKSCRRDRSRLQRKTGTAADMGDSEAWHHLREAVPDYAVLTNLPPGELRHLLLHRAMELVRIRAARQRRRRWESDDEIF